LPKFAEVLVNRSRAYTYGVPAALEQTVAVGSVVEVPLRQKTTTGFVTALVPRPEFPTKDIVAVKQTARVFNESLIVLVKWMAEYYRCNLSTAWKTILPRK
jgi:primosomal protein N'